MNGKSPNSDSGKSGCHIPKNGTVMKNRTSKTKKSKKKRGKSISDNDGYNISSLCKEKHKKSKTKRSISRKYSKHSSISSSSSESSGDLRRKHRKSSKCSRSGSRTDFDEWVEQVDKSSSTLNNDTRLTTVTQRDSWMTDGIALKTYQQEKNIRKFNDNQKVDIYDPAQSNRELNPYWKSTGTGLPSTFKKPRNYSDEEDSTLHSEHSHSYLQVAQNWKKKISTDSSTHFNIAANPREKSVFPETKSASVMESGKFLTDEEMNELGAKIIKAEIMGNIDLAKQLKDKLEIARTNRECFKESKRLAREDKQLLPARTDSGDNCRPPPLQRTRSIYTNLYGGRSGKGKANHRMETDEGGERVRFFADDDKHDIKQMFKREKFTTAAEYNLEFSNIMSKHKNINDDMEDIFADRICKNISHDKIDKKEFLHSTYEQRNVNSNLENCHHCLDGNKVEKRSIISIGEKVYLALPWHIGLQTGHCILVSTQHVSCSTLLDEDTWEEITNFRKALTKMYAAQKKDVIFFEIANKLKSNPHLCIHCVPIRDKDAEMVPFYFKKAIEESEHEWSVNKQLVSLRNKGLRSSIPKGLPYFWIHFGMDNGFAHVIEDQERFPSNFAHEIIGGLLHLDSWRRPQKEHNIVAKVKLFTDNCKKYDCTSGIFAK